MNDIISAAKARLDEVNDAPIGKNFKTSVLCYYFR